MKLDVTEPVAAYLAAEEVKDAEKLALCFSDDGTVRDEEEVYHGREAIQKWKEEADAKHRFLLLPLHAHAQGDELIVRARITGDFPGNTQHGGTRPHLQAFGRQDCFTRNQTMTLQPIGELNLGANARRRDIGR
jgi:ketosteroid isomerase-like protein